MHFRVKYKGKTNIYIQFKASQGCKAKGFHGRGDSNQEP